jgi:hypothetical protein
MPNLPTGHWAIDVEKELLGEYWTNRYIVVAPDLAGATAAGLSIATMERAFHKTPVLFTKMRASDGQTGTDIYSVQNLNYFGQQAANGEHLALFNVMRVDFNVSGGGRPSRKYYRCPIGEGEQASGKFLIEFLNGIAPSIQALVDFTPYVDVDGQPIVSGSVYPNVGMRQLRRGSKRATPPPNPGP